MSNTQQKTLPQDTTGALKELVSVSRNILDSAERETQCLVMGDLISFAMIQHDKEYLADRYAKASGEFRSRIDEFRGAQHKAMIAQLDNLQRRLKEKTQENNILIDQIRRRATANTRATLFTAQEMGQRVRFLQDTERESGSQKGA